MSVQDKFQLYVYDGDFGLPSVDVECSQSILYTAISKVPVQVKLLNNVKNCLLFSAPSFIHKNLTFKSFNETVLYLRTLNYNLDASLNAKQWSESFAITNLVRSKLRPVVDYVYWLDQRNCDDFTCVWYMKALPIPFNYIHTKRFKEDALTLIETLYPQEDKIDTVKDYLNTVATDCFSTLSARLGTADYFYGNSPTTLDVIVYGHIAPLMKLPFPSNDISNLVTMWPNLVNLMKRIDAKYFPQVTKESKYIKSEAKTKNSDDEVSYVALSILTVSAISLVLGFAFSRGIITSGVFS